MNTTPDPLKFRSPPGGRQAQALLARLTQRIQRADQNREEAISQKRWSHVSGFDGIGTGLLYGRNFVVQIFGTDGPCTRSAYPPVRRELRAKTVLDFVLNRRTQAEKDLATAVRDRVWSQVAGLDGIATGLRVVEQDLREVFHLGEMPKIYAFEP